MKKLLSIALLLLAQLFASGQPKSFTVAGKVTDSASLDPLASVSIKVKGTALAAKTNAKGDYSITVGSLPAVLIFSHLNYQPLEVKIENAVTINVMLQKKPTLLRTLSVNTNKPQTIAPGQPLFIKDYDFCDGKLIVLAYKDKMLSQPMLCLLTPDGDSICTLRIRESGKLFRDCFNNDHLVTKTTAWQMYIDSNYVDLIYPSEIEKFNQLLKPVLAEKNNRFFYGQYAYNDQLLQYVYYDKSARKVEKLRTIADDSRLFMLRDKARMVLGADDPDVQERFENLAFYKPLFAPLLKINDTICIFNCVDSVIEFYSDSCTLVKEVPISFHNNSNWKREIFVDHAMGKVYALFRKNGITMLREISLQSGELKDAIAIPEYPYIENIRVYNNFIYFLYTEHDEPGELKRLYKMKI